MYTIEIEHPGLLKHRIIRGHDSAIVERKAELQMAAWDEQWARRTARIEKQSKTAEAAARTDEAQQANRELLSLLSHTLRIDDQVDWEALKRSYNAPAAPPAGPAEPRKEVFAAKLGLFDHLFTFRKRRKLDESEARFRQALIEWQRDVEEWRRGVEEWRTSCRKLKAEIREHNITIDAQKSRYMSENPDAIEEYCDLVLSRSSYPSAFPQEFQIDYAISTKTLVVDYQLPAPEVLSTLQEVRYVAVRNEFKEVHLKDREFKTIYGIVIYQIALRTIHELFEADQIDAIDAVVFNGWVHSIDRRSGNHIKACIASVQALKKEFSLINLAAVEPKECFRALKGVAAADLASMVPVAPILQLNKQDRRFVASQEVASTLDEGTNVAAIGWEEFEHLVREIFAAEFSAGGGEVKVTQSSRDWGVDAVAFDPDPIRGGKIVIQAKRYSNTVDVAAVRDLYGTVMNEGATKGILVTTFVIRARRVSIC
jgi:restriction system protein